MKPTLVTSAESARLDCYVGQLAYYFDLRASCEAYLSAHRSQSWWRRLLAGGSRYERRVIATIRIVDEEINNLTIGVL